jgi:ubiquinone/menaquinone biosynthesis C-methylase UbiE
VEPLADNWRDRLEKRDRLAATLETFINAGTDGSEDTVGDVSGTGVRLRLGRRSSRLADAQAGRGKTSDVIRRHWDRRARGFDEEAGHGLFSEDQRTAWLDLLSTFVGSTPRRVLDVGCGTGFLALRFAELGHTVTGIDLAPQMLDQARRKAKQASLEVDLRVGDAAALDLGDANYDVIAARHVLWNLPDPGQGLAEWLRVLRPGGQLLLIEGKWANNGALARSYARPSSRLLAWAERASDRIAAHTSPALADRALARRYGRIEAQLPFAGGPPAGRLVAFLEANGVHDVTVVPLMDPVFWGETPRFARYLAAGTRPAPTVEDPVASPPPARGSRG